MASAPLLLVLAPAAASLALAQLLLGVFQLFAALASQSYVAGLANGRSLERNYASYATLLSAGRLVGPLLAGVAIDARGIPAAFAIAAAASLFTFASAWGIRGALGGRAAASPGASGSPAAGRFGARAALRNVGVQLAVLSSAGVFVAISVHQAFLPVALQQQGYAATTIGALISLGALSAVVLRPLMPYLARSFGGPAPTLVVAMSTVAVGVGLMGVAGSIPAFVLLVVAMGFGTGIGLPLSLVTVASHVDPRQRGAALGLRLSLNRAAQLGMPVLIGAVIGSAGFGVGIGVAGGTLLGLVVAVVVRVPAFERSAPRA